VRGVRSAHIRATMPAACITASQPGEQDPDRRGGRRRRGTRTGHALGAKYGRQHHDILLVERNLTHIWKPLLHEVAAGSLDANLDEVGYRSHCHRWGYRFFYGAMETIDRTARQIVVAPLIDEDGRELIGAIAPAMTTW